MLYLDKDLISYYCSIYSYCFGRDYFTNKRGSSDSL